MSSSAPSGHGSWCPQQHGDVEPLEVVAAGRAGEVRAQPVVERGEQRRGRTSPATVVARSCRAGRRPCPQLHRRGVHVEHAQLGSPHADDEGVDGVVAGLGRAHLLAERQGVEPALDAQHEVVAIGVPHEPAVLDHVVEHAGDLDRLDRRGEADAGA